MEHQRTRPSLHYGKRSRRKPIRLERHRSFVVSEVYYKIVFGYWFSLTLVLATQLTGFGLAGLCRRFLVWPASMVWPQNLVACTLLNTLHAEDEDDGIGMYLEMGLRG